MSDLIDDVKMALAAYREAPPGSYLETTLANDIVRDLVPALVHRVEHPPRPLGFEAVTVTELETETELKNDD